MLRRSDRVLSTDLLNELLRADLHNGLRADVLGRLRARLHELLLGRIFELLRSGRDHQLLRGWMVSRLLGRSSSHTVVGLAYHVCRIVPRQLCSVLRAEHLLIVPGWLRGQLRSRMSELLDVCFVRTRTLQLVFDVHSRLCARSRGFVMRLQLV